MSKSSKSEDQTSILAITPGTRAPVPSPPRKTKSRLMDMLPEAPPQASDNLTKPNAEKLKDLSFKVDEAFHREMKAAAANWGMSMKDLLTAAFKVWIDQNGEAPRNRRGIL